MKGHFIEDEQRNVAGQYPYYHEDEDEISLKELMLVLIKGKKIIAVVTALAVAVTLIGSVLISNINIGTKGEVQTAVRLYFDGIEKGMTPDGLPYDSNEIKAAEVLEKAMSDMSINNKPSASDVAECITLTAVIPDEAAETLQNISDLKTEDLKLEKLESLEIHPDTYILSFDVKNKLGLSLEEGRELLDNVILEYKNQLMQKYSDYSVLADTFAGDFSVDKYDYIQATDLMNEQIQIMEQYTKNCITDDNFTSQVTGMSKANILNALEAVRDVNIELLYTKIAVSYATKNAAKSVAIYEKLAEDKQREYSKSNEEASSLYALITNFKVPEQTLVINNSTGGAFSLKKQNAQYDSMVTRYTVAAGRATTALADSNYYAAEAERFRNSDTFSGADSQEAKEIVKLLDLTKKNVTQNMKVINKTVKDYYNEKAYKKYAEQLIPTQSYDKDNGMNLPLNLAIALAAGLILGVLIVLFKEYLKTEEEGGSNHED
ncbi:YveK family protein [Aminipila terrae]|uniref:Polysaccharide chain length determinant N-terminal domain-containing protein n=1 Tax=Aminipila terrae TaxID=2697030 RepID=A0A6P1MI79_9FIRM|nr:hypothetical protein [Aminipila terrae]QHI71306.1 hypothetical protein Ami3637_01845 [Aminipila terrae]